MMKGRKSIYFSILLSLLMIIQLTVFSGMNTITANQIPNPPRTDSANESPAEAAQLQNNSIAVESIGYIGDVDYFNFTLMSKMYFTIWTETLSPDYNTYLRIYDTNQFLVAENDDYNNLLQSRISMILEAGTYTATVRAAYDDDIFDNYEVHFRTSTTVVYDNYETDDTFETASMINLNSTQVRNLGYSTYYQDVDIIEFTITTPTEIEIQINGYGADIMIDIVVEGWWHISRDTISNGILSYTISQGTYQLYIVSANLVQVSQYDISLNAYDAVAGISQNYDTYENDDSFENAKTITLGETQYRSFHLHDFDYIQFEIATDRLVNFTVNVPDYFHYEIYGENNNFFMYNENYGSFRSMWWFPAGIYTMKAQGGYPMDYSLTISIPDFNYVSEFDDYEFDNDLRTPSYIENNTTQTRSLYHGDVDFIQFYLATETIINVEIESSIATMLLIKGEYMMSEYDANYGYDYPNLGIYNLALSPGYYHLQITHFRQNAAIPQYNVTLETIYDGIAPDQYENNNSPETATPITVNSTQSHSLLPNDRDYLTFTIEDHMEGVFDLNNLDSVNINWQLWIETDLRINNIVLDGVVFGNNQEQQSSILVPGTYFISFETDDVIESTRYEFRFEAYTVDFEPDHDNSFETATFMNQSSLFSSIQHAGDIDIFEFYIEEASDIHIFTNLDFGGDTVIVLFDGNRNFIEYNDDDLERNTLESSLRLQLDSGTYFIVVTALEFQDTIQEFEIVIEITDESSTNQDDRDPSPTSSSTTLTENDSLELIVPFFNIYITLTAFVITIIILRFHRKYELKS